MARFQPAWEFLQELEGGNILHQLQGDPGGRTIFGIAENMHPGIWELGPPDEERAKRFYEATYWYPLRLDKLRDQGMAEEIFEFAVNGTAGGRGRNIAVRAAQRATNAVRRALEWVLIKEDGVMGKKTLQAMNELHSYGAVASLAWDGAFNIEQLRHYRTLRKDLVQRFLHGWTRRVVL